MFSVRNSAVHVEGFDYLFDLTSAQTPTILPPGAVGTVTQGSTTYASGAAASAEMDGYRSHGIKP